MGRTGINTSGSIDPTAFARKETVTECMCSMAQYHTPYLGSNIVLESYPCQWNPSTVLIFCFSPLSLTHNFWLNINLPCHNSQLWQPSFKTLSCLTLINWVDYVPSIPAHNVAKKAPHPKGTLLCFGQGWAMLVLCNLLNSPPKVAVEFSYS